MIWKIKDNAGLLINSIHTNYNDIPKALPWIEPSINNLYLEAVSSFLFGNYFSSIVTASILLEHTLRLAVVNKEECGLKRENSINEIDSYNSLKNVIDEAIKKRDIFIGCDEQWWRDTAKYIRNKTAHYLLPKILRECAKQESFKNYFDPLTAEDRNEQWYYEKYLIDWGSFYHKDDRRFAKYFLNDVYKQLLIVISNTKWIGDESWWKSQKEIYDSFFDFNWTCENTIKKMDESFGKNLKDLKTDK